MGKTLEHHGCGLAYDVRGDGPPVLFIQGVGAHGAGWTPQTAALADQFRCLTFDNRGIGRSLPVHASLSVEQMADDARAILDAERLGQVHVVGHSLGGLVALCLALTEPERVRSLALLCTFADGRAAAPFTTRLCWLGLRARVGTPAMRRRAFVRLVAPPGARGPAELDALAGRLSAVFGYDLGGPPAVAGRQLQAMRNYSAARRLGELRVPTLVVSAAHDPIAPPRLGRLIADGVSGARCVEIEDASHALPVTHPERVNELLREHFAAASAGDERQGQSP